MRIASISVRGFRCFDANGVCVEIDDLSCLVGPNASGKTSLMLALVRMFGENRGQRQIQPSDFHVPLGQQLAEESTRSLCIECRLEFPELSGEETGAVPETFNQMVVDDPGAPPYCRIRLDATWTNDRTSEGDVQQKLWWILTTSEDEGEVENSRQAVSPNARGLVRVIYVPAGRNPTQQVRHVTESSFGRMVRSISMASADEAIRKNLAELQGAIAKLEGVKTLSREVKKSWSGVYQGELANEVEFQSVEEEPGALIRRLAPVFRPGEDGSTVGLERLSDGLRSLFSLSLSLGFYRLENVVRSKAEESGFREDAGQGLPALTLFAVEEPENHLSPHYLGQVVSELRKVSGDDSAQVLVSSHSPSVLGRMPPEDVRYFLGHEGTSSSTVKQITLPVESEESAKYVREAVRAYPELYFSRLVILGEGPSEEIVLRRLFEVSGMPLDHAYISIVPLGGRHVNHFWRLLNDLQIPHITLLDLDREKQGAGWGRVQYVRDQLLKVLADDDLTFDLEDDTTDSLKNPIYDSWAENDDSEVKELSSWVGLFEDYGVFFSSPLDLDLCMLKAFPAAYKAIAPANGGPNLPDANEDPEGYKEEVYARVRQVLAKSPAHAPATLGQTYSKAKRELFPWYKYLFIDGSKPANHVMALSSISDEDLRDRAPAVLRRLLDYASSKITGR